MPRPAGAPFWGESRGPNDYSLLTGVSDYWDTANATLVLDNDYAIAAVRYWGEGDTGTYYDDYLVPHDGWSGVVLAYSAGTYLEPSDTGLTTTWMVRARGAGTVTAYDDQDPTWDYGLPGNPLGTATISSAGWELYPFPTSTFTVADLLDTSAAQRFGMQVTGNIQIDVVQLRIWPASGALGGWTPKPAENTTQLLNTTEILIGRDGTLGSGTSAGSPAYAAYEDAYASMVANLAGIDERNSGTVVSGRGGAFTQAHDNVVSSLDGSTHQWKWAYYTGYLSCSVGNIAALTPTGYLGLTEGVDYIRRPDRVVGDLRAYWAWSGGAPTVTGWDNATARFQGSKSADDTNGAYDWAGGGTVTYAFINYVKPGTPSTWVPAQISVPPDYSGVVLDVPDPGPVDEYIPLALPLEPAFSMVMDNSFMDAMPPAPDLTGVSIQGGSSIAISGSLSLGGPGDQLVAARVLLPPYQIWSPVGALSWTRQKQRSDGYGTAPRRARSYSSIRQRGIQ